jgi:two-component system KDP operon response regulator KdpE
VRILLADDDEQLQRALRITLSARGYEVLQARDGAEAIDLAANGHLDLIVLDLGMPRVGGVDVIRAVRSWSSVPILVLSGRTDSSEKVEALDAGADDYVTKPFAMDELLARIRARSRRPTGEDDAASVRIGDLVVDLAARTVRTADGGASAVRLTPTEWRLLELLLRNPGKLMTRQMLLGEVWGPYHSNDGGYLRLYIAQLRRKLEPVPSKPRYLVTEAGMGYRFDP